jgi:transposase InsO family protein
LGLKKERHHLDITGVGQANANAQTAVDLIIHKPDKTKICTIGYVLDRVTPDHPPSPICRDEMPLAKELPLADPCFDRPSGVELLLGMDVYEDIVLGEKKQEVNNLFFRNTIYGWVVVGAPHSTTSASRQRVTVQHTATASAATTSTDTLLRQFWEVEDVPTCTKLTEEEARCKEHFETTTTRDDSGRIVVSLPFKTEPPPLGDSFQSAQKRFMQLERRLEANPQLKKDYQTFIDEFLDLDHMEKVPPDELDLPTHKCFYLPHHCVTKESTTTKLRVVFDGSATTSSGFSLNDTLMLGPRNQDDLIIHIFRFRFYNFALSADIAKMYRQVALDSPAKDYHRLLWRSDPTKTIEVYRMKRVIYGVRSAGYHATSALQMAAGLSPRPTSDWTSRTRPGLEPRTSASESGTLTGQEKHQNLPTPGGLEPGTSGSLDTRLNHSAIEDTTTVAVTAALWRDFYMDDCMSGAETFKGAVALQDGLINVLNKIVFPLRKWAASDKRLIERLPAELRETKDSLEFASPDYNIKALGVRWFPAKDVFMFWVKFTPVEKPTKRQFLSDISRLFDPMGWLAPVIIQAKVLMQLTWTRGVGWDEELPDDMLLAWSAIREHLPTLEKLEIPRGISHTAKKRIELHAFSDASEKAYAACVYARVLHKSGDVMTTLLLSKTRVAPVKTISLPRLELCGAHLAAKLITTALEALQSTDFKIAAVHAWTDSTITLAWISAEPRRWTSFVANRVSAIQDAIAPELWAHVPSPDNPADCATRGLDIPSFIQHELWWNGPVWLQKDKSCWPARTTPILEDVPEARKAARVHTACIPEPILNIENFSSWSRLCRSIAYVFRFIRNCRKPSARDPTVFQNKPPALCTRQQRAAKQCADISDVPFLQSSELSAARDAILLAVQAQQFDAELSCLSKKKPLPTSSNLLPLAPFINTRTGHLLVGGRLSQSDHAHHVKHPVLLDSKHHVATLLIRFAHAQTLHGGPQATLGYLQQRYWIVGARSKTRQMIKDCVTCKRFCAPKLTQLMGSLPEQRVTPSKAFVHTGIDFGGPFTIKVGPRKTAKAYLALLVCFSTKAVHLEAVSSLTKEACLAALRRFVARRGRPLVIYSDNATNFTGARNELQELKGHMAEKGADSVASHMSCEGVEWKMIPPRAPHFGGLWEAGIKSAKHHIRRIVGQATLTFEELSTVFAQIEAALNSRPLYALRSDPNDLEVLTPGHFLIGTTLLALPDYIQAHNDLHGSLLRRWAVVQELTHQFWRRWHTDYLATLQPRKKWHKPGHQLQVGDLVLLMESNQAPLEWPRGRVLEIFPGKDNICRVARVKTFANEYVRPVHKLILLQQEEKVEGSDPDSNPQTPDQ